MGDSLNINQAEMHELLHGAGGEVWGELRKLGKTVQRGAARRAPHPKVAAGVVAHEPVDAPEGPYVDIETAAESDDGAPIGLFAEVGTKPHDIESHGDYPLRNKATGQVFGKKVHHPGTKEHPHLRPALYEDFE